MRRSAWVLALLVPLALASAPIRDAHAADDDEKGEGAAEHDDPIGRRRAEIRTEGLRGPEISAEILRLAEEEALKYGLKPHNYELPVRQAGSAWINLGPSTADFAKNGSKIQKVDSGRLRNLIVHPLDPNIVYVAVAGGGVWKTFDAKTALTSTTGPSWAPITEGIGALSIGALALKPNTNPAVPDSLLLGLGDPHAVKTTIGILHSEDGGATWSSPFALAGQYPGSSTTFTSTSTRDIAFDRTGSGRVLVCTDAGLFKADNFGQGSASSWSLVSPDTTNKSQECWSLNQIGTTTTWLMATVDSDGLGQLYRSTDNGTSWASKTSDLPAPSGSPAGFGRGTLASTGADTNAATARVYLLAGNYDSNQGRGTKQRDVFRSDDGGATWTSSLAFAGSGHAPTNPTTGLQTDLDVMHDQADYNQAIVVDPKNANTLFIGGNLSLLRSLDGGTTWSVFANWLPPAYSLNLGMYAHADWHAATIAYDGTVGALWGGNDGGLFKSTDALTAPNPSGTNASAAVTWEDRFNRGLVTHLAYTVATPAERGTVSASTCNVGAVEKEIVFGGLQDNGTRLRGNGTATADGPNTPTTFNQVAGGDGFGVGIGCAGASTSMGSLLLSTYVAKLSYSVNSGTSFTSSFTNTVNGITLDQNYNFVMIVATDHADPAGKSFLVPITDDTSGAGYLLYTHDVTGGWVDTKGTLKGLNETTQTAAASAAGPFPNATWSAQADNVHLGHWALTTRAVPQNPVSGRVWVTTNGNATSGSASTATWYALPRIDLPKVNTRSEYLAVKSAALDPTSATGDIVWAASGEAYTRVTPTGVTNADNYLYKPVPSTQGRVWRTANATLSAKATGTTTWTAQAPDGSGLPNVPVNVIKIDPNDPNTVYAGTELGLYRGTFNGTSTTWTRYGTGLPLVSVTDLALAADGSSIRVATFGRGFWEIQPKSGGSTAGVPGNGDLDHNQQIDGFDLVRLAAIDKTTSADDSYDATGNLAGTTNAIDDADLTKLVQKLGGRP